MKYARSQTAPTAGNHMDVYRKFADLKAVEREEIDYRVCVVWRPGASTVVLAPHGGDIEPGTSEIAQKIAADCMSLAIFEGLDSDKSARLHITSTNFDEPRCLQVVEAAENVIAIHGEASRENVVFVGGRDTTAGTRLRTVLESHGYKVRPPDNPRLQGVAASNVCNRGRRGAGVQLELSSGLRRTFFESLSTAGRKKPTEELSRFAGAVREGLVGAALQATSDK